MSEQHGLSEPAYDPLWSARRKPRSRKANLAIALSIAAHAGLFYYIYETKFVVHYKSYSEEVLQAKIVTLPKTPPPPEPLKQQAPPPPPPLIQHAAVAPPIGIDAPPPLVFTPPEPPAPPAPAPQQPATPQPVAPRTIVNPDWSSRPSGEDVARYYPERAQRLEQAGNVTLQCQVTAKGTVAGCSVLSETPGDFGFGEAALKLSRLFRMKPKMEDGQAVEGAQVRIPIAFRIG